ncbi:MAG: hypothetical protein GKR88_04350 [Flavobacteriaceae bacterium]|nr:MAG: hypothetical protein GKR88_04350 [Flavobacteriaceae bacterium]
MKKTFLLMALLGVLMLNSCKSTSASLQRATATTIGNTLASQVSISNVKRGGSNVSWEAKKDGKCYKCEADDMVRRTNCVKVECKD